MLAPGGESGRAHQSRRELPEVRKTRHMGGASVHLVFLRIRSSLIAGRTGLRMVVFYVSLDQAIWAGSFIVTELSTAKNMDGMCSLKD